MTDETRPDVAPLERAEPTGLCCVYDETLTRYVGRVASKRELSGDLKALKANAPSHVLVIRPV